MAKQFIFDNFQFSIEDPANIAFANPFYEDIYRALYGIVIAPNYTAQINVDDIYANALGFDIRVLAAGQNVKVQKPTAASTNPDRLSVQYCIRKFLE